MSYLRFALLVVVALIIVASLALTVRSEGIVAFVVAAVAALVPLGVYFGATVKRRRADVLLLGVVLLAYAGLFAAAAPSYDDDAQGGLIFLFLPIYGSLALLVTWGLLALVRAGLNRTARVRPK